MLLAEMSNLLDGLPQTELLMSEAVVQRVAHKEETRRAVQLDI